MSKTDDLYKLLSNIQKHPGMYVLDNSYEERYRELWVLISGYEMALEINEVTEVGRNFQTKFGKFLSREFGWDMSRGPMGAIEFQAGSAKQAWQDFWELLNRYMDAEKTSKNT